VDLRTWLVVPGVTTVVQFDTVKGVFNAELLADDAPKTVAISELLSRGAYTAVLSTGRWRAL